MQRRPDPYVYIRSNHPERISSKRIPFSDNQYSKSYQSYYSENLFNDYDKSVLCDNSSNSACVIVLNKQYGRWVYVGHMHAWTAETYDELYVSEFIAQADDVVRTLVYHHPLGDTMKLYVDICSQLALMHGRSRIISSSYDFSIGQYGYDLDPDYVYTNNSFAQSVEDSMMFINDNPCLHENITSVEPYEKNGFEPYTLILM